MVLVLREMQSVSSRIWTRVVVSISYDDNHYTTSTSKYAMLYIDLFHNPWYVVCLLQNYNCKLHGHNKNDYRAIKKWRIKLAPGEKNLADVKTSKESFFQLSWTI